MSHNFLSPRTIFSPHSPIMIALDPKGKESLCSDHRIINLFILIKFLQVSDISPNITDAYATYQIYQVDDANDYSCHILVGQQEAIESNRARYNSTDQQNGAYDSGCMVRRVQFDGYVRLSNIGIIHIKEHISKATCYGNFHLRDWVKVLGRVDLIRLPILHIIWIIIHHVLRLLIVAHVVWRILIHILGRLGIHQLYIQIKTIAILKLLFKKSANIFLSFIYRITNYTDIAQNHQNKVLFIHVIIQYLFLVYLEDYNNIQSMYKAQSGNRIQKWLAYAPLIYNRLLIFPIPFLSSINSIKWLRGVTTSNTSFKFHEGFFSVSGSGIRTSQSGSMEGSLGIYKCCIPLGGELDDDRLKPSIKIRSQWNFKQEIQIVQQYGNSLQDVEHNNMYAISYKKYPTICLVSTRKLLDDGNHNQYADTTCVKLQSHKQPITSIKWVNFEGSNHKLLTSSHDGNIIQWDIQKITLQRQLKYHKQSVEAITPIYNYSSVWGQGPVASHANSIASVSTDGNIFIWDKNTATPVNKINARQKQLFSVECISTFGLITGGSDGTVKVWDLRNMKQYLYETKLDKSYGHQGKIREIKVNRYIEQNEKNKSSQKLSLGRIKFSTSGDDGKIIEWEDKLSFVHEGHQNPSTFDLNQSNNLVLSAQMKKNTMMLWQPGNALCQNQY